MRPADAQTSSQRTQEHVQRTPGRMNTMTREGGKQWRLECPQDLA